MLFQDSHDRDAEFFMLFTTKHHEKTTRKHKQVRLAALPTLGTPGLDEQCKQPPYGNFATGCQSTGLV